MRNTKGEAHVYMDNYSVHHSKQVREFFNDRIQQRFLPAYSCALNPIEKLWMLVKGQWRRRTLAKPQGMSEDEMERELKEIMLSFNEQCKSLARCHIQHMIKSLRGMFV